MSELSITPEGEPTAENPSGTDEVKLAKLRYELRSEQSILLGVIGGLGASIVAAVLWALIAYMTGYTLGVVAIGVGIIVGYSVGFLGKGLDMTFGLIGAFFALFGCLLGNLLTVLLFASQVEALPLTSVAASLITSPGVIIEIFKETFSPIDLIFYGIAVYEGYKFSFRRISEQEMASVQKRPEA
jgi:hypothetical protein